MKDKNILDEALALWNSLTRYYDSKENAFSELHQLDPKIKRAVELDETGITAVMILSNALEDYASNTHIPLAHIIDDLDKIRKFIDDYRDLQQLLHNPGLEHIVLTFMQNVKTTMIKTGFCSTDTDDLDEIFNDRYGLAELRLSALNATKNMSVYQFARDIAVKAADRNSFNFSDAIYEYYDINDLLATMASSNDGIVLCLVRDTSDDRFSYFVFAIKNGGNVWLAGDRKPLPSPNYRNVGRHAARNKRFSDRVSSYFFPYDLIGAEYDPEMYEYVIRRRQGKSVQLFSPHKICGRISNTKPVDRVWLSMLLVLLYKKYFVDLHQEPELSYTPLMISTNGEPRSEFSLVQQNSDIQYKPVIMPKMTVQYLNYKNHDLHRHWDRKPVGVNSWMEDRYASKIDLPDLEAISGEMALLKSGRETTLDERYDLSWSEVSDLERSINVPTLDRTEFGTAEDLMSNRIWFARNNYAQRILLLAKQEYLEKKKEIRRWYKEQLKNNMQALLAAVAQGEYVSRVTVVRGEQKQGNILRLVTVKDYNGILARDHIFCRGHNSGYGCYLTGRIASYVAEFSVGDAQAIADVCGLSFEQLPVYLQHVARYKCDVGNRILENIDPMDVVDNPWNQINWDVSIFLSKSGYKQLCKEHGATPREIADY